jgi:hypothetical protein
MSRPIVDYKLIPIFYKYPKTCPCRLGIYRACSVIKNTMIYLQIKTKNFVVETAYRAITELSE